MKGENFYSDQPILQDDLSRAQSTKEEAINERMSDIFSAGILENSQFSPADADEQRALNIIPGSNNIAGNPTITVRSGIAYSPSGERIIISDLISFESAVVGVSTVVSGNPVLPDGTINGPLTKTDNGISGFTLTPRSSGSVNIPLIQSATNKIWLGYLKTIDPSVFTLRDIANERLFVKATDGYEIRVTTSDVNPDSSRFFLLGEVVVTNIVLSSNISFSNTEVCRTEAHRVGLKINSVKKPASYTETAATLLGSVAAASFNVNTETFIVAVNNGSDQTATFVGVDPIAIATVVTQINSQIFGLTASVENNQIRLISDDIIQIKNGTANTDLGFTNGQLNKGYIVSLDDHVNSIGTGFVSPNNPHGISTSDLGIANLQDIGATLNSSGLIVPNTNATGSALFPIATASGTPQDNKITFKALLPTEKVNVDGAIITDIDIGADVVFKFVDLSDVPIADGIYTFYINKTTRQIEMSLPNEVVTGVDKFLLAKITWTAPTLVLPYTDLRFFGTTANPNLRLETLGALAWGLATGNRTSSFTYDIYDRISTITVAGDTGSVGGVSTVITLTYDAPSTSAKVVSVIAVVGNRTLTTSIAYSGNNVSTVTESIS